MTSTNCERHINNSVRSLWGNVQNNLWTLALHMARGTLTVIYVYILRFIWHQTFEPTQITIILIVNLNSILKFEYVKLYWFIWTFNYYSCTLICDMYMYLSKPHLSDWLEVWTLWFLPNPSHMIHQASWGNINHANSRGSLSAESLTRPQCIIPTCGMKPKWFL